MNLFYNLSVRLDDPAHSNGSRFFKPKVVASIVALALVVWVPIAVGSHDQESLIAKQSHYPAPGVTSGMLRCGHSEPKRSTPILKAVVGRALSGVLREVTTCSAPGAFSKIKISWGDGTVSAGRITASRHDTGLETSWSVVFTGRHVYRRPTCPHPPIPGASTPSAPTKLPCPGFRLSIHYRERTPSGGFRTKLQTVLVYVSVRAKLHGSPHPSTAPPTTSAPPPGVSQTPSDPPPPTDGPVRPGVSSVPCESRLTQAQRR